MKTSIKQSLKAQAHHLKPVVMLGAKGLTPAVVEETNTALLSHELIKVKINGADKAAREAIGLELSQQLDATLIQSIGNTLILFRKNIQNP